MSSGTTPKPAEGAPTPQNAEAHDSGRSAASSTNSSVSNAQRFLRDAAEKSADLVHREIIRKGMESYDVAHAKGKTRFAFWEAARQRCQEIKREAVNHLDQYLLEFEKNVIAHDGHG